MNQVWAGYKWGLLSKIFPCDFSHSSECSEIIDLEMRPSQMHYKIIQAWTDFWLLTGYFCILYMYVTLLVTFCFILQQIKPWIIVLARTCLENWVEKRQRSCIWCFISIVTCCINHLWECVRKCHFILVVLINVSQPGLYLHSARLVLNVTFPNPIIYEVNTHECLLHFPFAPPPR